MRKIHQFLSSILENKQTKENWFFFLPHGVVSHTWSRSLGRVESFRSWSTGRRYYRHSGLVICLVYVYGDEAVTAPTPESSKRGGKKSFRGAHGKRRARDAKGVEVVGNGDGVFPSPLPQPTKGSGVEVVGNGDGVSPLPQPTKGSGVAS